MKWYETSFHKNDEKPSKTVQGADREAKLCYLASHAGAGLCTADKETLMLIGEYIHTIDDKSRISLPSKFRKEIGKKLVLTRGLDNCLFLYSLKEWKSVSEKLALLPMGQADTRGFGRFMFAGAVEIDVDALGRILIPDFLKDFAKLAEKVVFAGVQTRVELWNETAWDEYKKRIETQGDALAEKLGQVGIF